jgi:thiamine biosynthesis lipoprotein ApbE
MEKRQGDTARPATATYGGLTGPGPAGPGTDAAGGAAADAAAGPETASAGWMALGCRVHLVVTDPSRLEEARSLLETFLAEVDAACSRFRPDSELVALDRAAGRPVRLSPLLAEAIGVALRAAGLTDGDVDPTVGEAIDAVGYDRDFALLPLDGPPLDLAVKAVPGWQQVRLDMASRTLIMPAGIRLDLGATAKAWASDRAAERLASKLGCGVLVGLGGDIAVAGQTPPGGWRVRVQDVTGRPEDPPGEPSAVVAIHGGGLATSSTTARRWRRGGSILHHILDPRTGLPPAPVWRTVSVTAATCADANAASTAAIIRGDRAAGWLEALGLPARLVGISGRVETVAGWPDES